MARLPSPEWNTSTLNSTGHGDARPDAACPGRTVREKVQVAMMTGLSTEFRTASRARSKTVAVLRTASVGVPHAQGKGTAVDTKSLVARSTFRLNRSLPRGTFNIKIQRQRYSDRC
jgi:hypothetical protein